MSTPLYDKGLALRRKVLGEKHIAKRQASPDPFTQQQNELVTEIAWGTLWSRPGLPLKVRSLVTLGMLTALDRPDEIKGTSSARSTTARPRKRSTRCSCRLLAIAASRPPTAPCGCTYRC